MKNPVERTTFYVKRRSGARVMVGFVVATSDSGGGPPGNSLRSCHYSGGGPPGNTSRSCQYSGGGPPGNTLRSCQYSGYDLFCVRVFVRIFVRKLCCTRIVKRACTRMHDMRSVKTHCFSRRHVISPEDTLSSPKTHCFS